MKIKGNSVKLRSLYESCAKLRVRAVFLFLIRLLESTILIVNLNFVTRVRLPSFLSLHDGNRLINILASNKWLATGKYLKMVSILNQKIVDAVLTKSSKFYLVRII